MCVVNHPKDSPEILLVHQERCGNTNNKSAQREKKKKNVSNDGTAIPLPQHDVDLRRWCQQQLFRATNENK